MVFNLSSISEKFVSSVADTLVFADAVGTFLCDGSAVAVDDTDTDE